MDFLRELEKYGDQMMIELEKIQQFDFDKATDEEAAEFKRNIDAKIYEYEALLKRVQIVREQLKNMKNK